MKIESLELLAHAARAMVFSTVFWRLAMSSSQYVASRPPGSAAWGLVLGPGGVRFGRATTSVVAFGVSSLGASRGGFRPLGHSVVEAPSGDAAHLSSVGGGSCIGPVLMFHKRVHVGVQV
jgi:hypothetical protein